jgi:hypothetical protein
MGQPFKREFEPRSHEGKTEKELKYGGTEGTEEHGEKVFLFKKRRVGERKRVLAVT